METGNIAWMLASLCLAFLMAIGIVFYYAGQARAKSVLNMIMLGVGAFVVVTLVWVLWGWSIARGGSDLGGLFGDPSRGFLLRDVVTANPSAVGASDGRYSAILVKGTAAVALLVTLLEGMAAVLAAVLMSGALAGRVKVSTWMVFLVLWVTLVFAPLAHMVWSPSGMLSPQGALSRLMGTQIHDLSGGAVVWLSAAVSALMVVLIIGRRRSFHVVPLKPHNMPMAMLGALIAWVGFLGFVGGFAAVEAGTAGVAIYSVLSALIAPAASALGWMIVEKIRTGHFTALGAVSGLIAGMAMAAALADTVGPMWVLVAGLFTGIICSFGASLKYRLGYDDALDIVPVCGIGGLLGMLFDGLFAQRGGLLTGGGLALFGANLLTCVIVMLWSGVLTALVAFVLEKTMGWRLADRDEDLGIDIADQGEKAYDFEDYTNSVYKEAK